MLQISLHEYEERIQMHAYWLTFYNWQLFFYSFSLQRNSGKNCSSCSNFRCKIQIKIRLKFLFGFSLGFKPDLIFSLDRIPKHRVPQRTQRQSCQISFLQHKETFLVWFVMYLSSLIHQSSRTTAWFIALLSSFLLLPAKQLYLQSHVSCVNMQNYLIFWFS